MACLQGSLISSYSSFLRLLLLQASHLTTWCPCGSAWSLRFTHSSSLISFFPPLAINYLVHSTTQVALFHPLFPFILLCYSLCLSSPISDNQWILIEQINEMTLQYEELLPSWWTCLVKPCVTWISYWGLGDSHSHNLPSYFNACSPQPLFREQQDN